MIKRLMVTLLLPTAAVYAAAPYITTVYEFRPAPGQFINELTAPEAGLSPEDLAQRQIAGSDADGARPGMVSLGGWGGYIVFDFGHPVVNVPGEYDFCIYGNAIRSQTAANGGSSEPGIVMVSRDENGDGLPNDPWYELRGSEYDSPATTADYSVTYFRPAADRALNADPDPEQRWCLDRTYIRWEDSEGMTGYIARNSIHLESYWPEWEEDDITFHGKRLANNYTNIGTATEPYWLLEFYGQGYVDNLPDFSGAEVNPENPGLKIDWAVDADGEPVHLSAIDFVKVYTAVNQQVGQLGESSTEIQGGMDLHPEASLAYETIAEPLPELEWHGRSLMARTDCASAVLIYDLQGRAVRSLPVPAGESLIEIPRLRPGIYLAHIGLTTLKIQVL